MRSTIDRLERVLVDAIRIVLMVGIVVFFAFLAYKILDRWGFEILFLGGFVLIIYGFLGRFPEYLARRQGWSRWEAQKRINLWLLFVVGVVVGSYWIPRELHFGTGWYWRILFGIAIGFLALITRRYR